MEHGYGDLCSFSHKRKRFGTNVQQKKHGVKLVVQFIPDVLIGVLVTAILKIVKFPLTNIVIFCLYIP